MLDQVYCWDLKFYLQVQEISSELCNFEEIIFHVDLEITLCISNQYFSIIVRIESIYVYPVFFMELNGPRYLGDFNKLLI